MIRTYLIIMDRPEYYVKENQLQRDSAKKFFDKCEGELKCREGETVLDVGCGPGDVTYDLLKPILPNDTKLVCVDKSEQMVNYGNTKYKSATINFDLLDIEDPVLPKRFAQGSFDKVFSLHCFHWVSDQRQALKNIHLLLKTGGLTFIRLPVDHAILYVNAELAKMQKWKPIIEAVKKVNNPLKFINDPATFYKSILNELCYKIIDVSLVIDEYRFPNFDCFLGFVISVNTVEIVDSNFMAEDFKSDVYKIAREKQLVRFYPDGSVGVETKYIDIIAEKY